MTQAVCFRCGEIKWGAFGNCNSCGARPESDDDLMTSLAFTDHYCDQSKLQQIGRDIKAGKRPQLSDAQKESLLPAIREIKVMLGLNRSVGPSEPKRPAPFNKLMIGSIAIISISLGAYALNDYYSPEQTRNRQLEKEARIYHETRDTAKKSCMRFAVKNLPGPVDIAEEFCDCYVPKVLDGIVVFEDNPPRTKEERDAYFAKQCIIDMQVVHSQRGK
jgi:hypothetical protein